MASCAPPKTSADSMKENIAEYIDRPGSIGVTPHTEMTKAGRRPRTPTRPAMRPTTSAAKKAEPAGPNQTSDSTKQVPAASPPKRGRIPTLRTQEEDAAAHDPAMS